MINNQWERAINQQNYYDTWVSLQSSPFVYGVSSIQLGNVADTGSSSIEVAWDEVWVYYP